jgi:hypothetical protein
MHDLSGADLESNKLSQMMNGRDTLVKALGQRSLTQSIDGGRG